METEVLLSSMRDGLQPSLLELVFLENMENMVKPAIRHVYVSLAGFIRWEGLIEKAEDLSWATLGLIEAYSILYRPLASTWIENLYGLTRVSRSPNHAPCSSSQRALSLAHLMLMPKLVALLQSVRPPPPSTEPDEGAPAISLRTKFVIYLRVFVRFLRSTLATVGDGLHLAERVSLMAFRLCYLAGLTQFHHPLFALLGTKMVKTKQLLKLRDNSALNSSYSHKNVVVPLADRPAEAANSRTMSLIVGLVLAVKAMAWFINTDLSEHHINAKIEGPRPVPAAPKSSGVCRGGIVPPHDTSLCPICLRARVDPCAATSGYVYCYLCVLEAVRRQQCCPITGIACCETDLLRLHDAD